MNNSDNVSAVIGTCTADATRKQIVLKLKNVCKCYAEEMFI